MKILLNGESLEVQGLSVEATMADLLQAMEVSLEKTGMTVMEIHADDEVLYPDDAEELGRRRVQEFQEVDFLAVTGSDLVRIGIQDSEEALTHLGEKLLAVSHELRLGHIKEAMGTFLDLLDGFEWLVTMIRSLAQGFPESFQESSLELQRHSLQERLEEQVGEARNAQENQDWVGLADILEYEFPDLLADCGSLFDAVRED